MASPDVEARRFSDVMQGHRPLRDPRVPPRLSRRTSEDSDPTSPRERVRVLEHQKRSSRSFKDRKGEKPTRRESDTALLPPIRVSTICQSPTSPTGDVTGDLASLPTSSPSSPFGQPGVTNSKCNPLSVGGGQGTTLGINNSNVSHLHTQTNANERELANNRKDAHSNMSMAETAESTRLSPIAGSDKIRARAERRVLKSMNDVINDITNGNTCVGGGGTKPTYHAGLPHQDLSGPAPKAKLKNKSRSMSMQTLPKLSASEEPFSIRRKIEQFRKWHEEQYTEKLKKLKVDRDKDKRDPHPASQTPVSSVATDFAKLLEENMQNLQKSVQTDKTEKRTQTRHPNASEKREDLPKKRRAPRCKSGATWHTWRDANDSYAYNDVSKYIEENDLLPPERAGWIRDWLSEIEKALNNEDKSVAEGHVDNVGVF